MKREIFSQKRLEEEWLNLGRFVDLRLYQKKLGRKYGLIRLSEKDIKEWFS